MRTPEEKNEKGEETPLVSVGLPTRNRATLLPRALQSLLDQTYRHIEYIVSDNASTDDTEVVIRSFAARDPRIRFVRQSRDINGIRNHEYVLTRARGEYFMWASDDDWWDPRFVEALVSVLEQHPGYGVAMSHYYQHIINDDNERTELRVHDFTNRSHGECYRHYLRGRKTPIFFFGLYRTDLLKKIMKRGTPICFKGPLLFLSEVALSTRLYSVPEPLHLRLQDRRPDIVRHPDNPFALAENKPFAITHYMLKTPWWLLTSPAIPLRRKHVIFGPWFWRAWLYKRKIAREWWRFVERHLKNWWRAVKEAVVFPFYYFHYAVTRLTGKPYFGRLFRAQQLPPPRANMLRQLIEGELERKKVSRQPGPFNILEIGSWAGVSTVLLASSLKASGLSGKLYCIDPWTSYKALPNVMRRGVKNDRVFRMFLYNIAASGVTDNVVIIRGTSDACAPLLKEEAFDCLYIDGDHSFTQFRKDLRNYLPLVREGGIVCGDDLEATREEIDYHHAFARRERDMLRDPKSGKRFHPGITLALEETFGQVAAKEGVWAMRKGGGKWGPLVF